MAIALSHPTSDGQRSDWVALARELGPRFAERAASHDGNDTFVTTNYAELREHRIFAAGVPAELGGGGASHPELSAMLRTLAHYCGSTALALSMHTHLVAVAAWRWRHEGAQVEAFLRRVAAEQPVLVSTGGSDFLAGTGTARKVDGGYRVTARKIFGSGSPAGSLLMTMAIYDDPQDGPTVLHFPVPLDAPGVKVLDNWRTLGMRATGSNDILLEDVFVPDAAIGARRPPGVWSHTFHVIATIAFPLVFSVYVGVAENARDLALREASRKAKDQNVQILAGEMDNELATAPRPAPWVCRRPIKSWWAARWLGEPRSARSRRRWRWSAAPRSFGRSGSSDCSATFRAPASIPSRRSRRSSTAAVWRSGWT